MRSARAAALGVVISMLPTGGAALAGDVTRPGDAIVPSSPNHPASEGAPNAIDNTARTKYLNFDELNTGFTVTPTGAGVVHYLTIVTANDAPQRDPISFVLEGSNDGATFTLIGAGGLAPSTDRFSLASSARIENAASYAVYRVAFPSVRNPDAANSMHIAEVQLAAKVDVTSGADAVSIAIPDGASIAPGQGVDQLFDDKLGTRLLVQNANLGGVSVDVTPAAGARVVTGLAYFSTSDDAAFPGRTPRAITLLGSNDGANFVPLFSTALAQASDNYQDQEFDFDNTVPYASYRIILDAPISSTDMQIGDLQLFSAGDEGEPAPCVAPVIPKGACCVTEDLCVEESLDGCIALGGVFAGPGTACGNINCGKAPACPCEHNDDGFINSQDFFDFLSDFFAGAAAADINADGFINSQDFFDFLTCFFNPPAGCAGGGAQVARAFAGPPGDPVNDHLPDMAFDPGLDEEIVPDTRPGGIGIEISQTRICVIFSDTATVSAANSLLNAIGARVLGAIPEIRLVVIALPSPGSLADLDAALCFLRNDPRVRIAVEDAVIGPTVVSAPSTGSDPNVADISANCPRGLAPVNPWLYSFPPSNAAGTDGNWGLEAVRAPQMWNLNDAIVRALNPSARIGVLDVGFNDTEARPPGGPNPPFSGDGLNNHPQTDLSGLRTFMWATGLPAPAFAPGARVHMHGQHVAGIIGARFNDGSGVEGMNPFARPGGGPEPHFIGVSFSSGGGGAGIRGLLSAIVQDLRNMCRRWPDMTAVNLSLGYNWHANATIDTNAGGNGAVRRTAASQGLIVRFLYRQYPDILFVSAAGNDSNNDIWMNRPRPLPPGASFPREQDALYASPFNYATLGPAPAFFPNFGPAANGIVVEALDATVSNAAARPHQWQYSKSDFSNVNGSVSAPGGRILSTVGNNIVGFANYETTDGTSMATPHVTGLIAYLKTLDPTLNAAQLRTLVTDTSTRRFAVVQAGESPGPTGAAATARGMIDAFSAVMAVDLVQGNNAVQRSLCDADDGSLFDGNARLDNDDEDNDGITNEIYDIVNTPDSRRGDGAVNMKDFRAFRDAWLQAQVVDGNIPFADVALDGQPNHFKKDLNFDGCVQAIGVATPAHPGGLILRPLNAGDCASAPLESWYPRYDFNGSGTLEAAGDQVNPGEAGRAPFKIDPDTGCAGLNPPAGCKRDIDVIGDPAIWGIDNERVLVGPAQDGIYTQMCGLGVNVPTAPVWQPQHNLFADRDADDAIDYLHSCDVHISLGPTNLGTPQEFDADVFWLRVYSYDGAAIPWEKCMIVPAPRLAKFKTIVTVPLYSSRQVLVEVDGIDLDAPFNIPPPCSKLFFNVRQGEDLIYFAYPGCVP